MKIFGLLGVCSGAIILVGAASAQDLYVFPADGQSQEQTEQDKLACNQWAVGETNYDPRNPPTAADANPSASAIEEPLLSCSGGGASGAAKGAAGGYVAGKLVNGKTSKSTKLGALTGGVASSQNKKACEAENAQIQQRNQQRRAQAEQQAIASGYKPPGTPNEYKRAYSACLEAKGYTVK